VDVVVAVGCPFSGTECIKCENEYRLIIDIDKVISIVCGSMDSI
jgi:hypothetical protein